MLSAEIILQAFSTMSEEQKTIFLQTIQQGNTVGNINTTGETTRTRRRPVRTCTLTYKERGCIQYMTSTYTIQTESIGELGYSNKLPMFLSRNFTTGFKNVKWEQTNEIGAVCVLPEEYDGKPNHCLFSDSRRTYVCQYGVATDLKQVIESTAKKHTELYKLRQESKDQYNNIKKKMRSLLVKNVTTFNKQRRVLKIWDLEDLHTIVDDICKNDYRVKAATKSDVQSALHAYRDNSSKRSKLIWILSRYKKRNSDKEILNGVKDSKLLLKEANEKKGLFPEGYRKYIRDAHAFFYPTQTIKEKDKKMAAIISTYWDYMKNDSGNELVSAKRILSAEGDDNNFLLTNKGIAGESLSILAKDMANALKLIVYSTRIKCNNGIIDELHNVMRLRSKFKKNFGSGRREETPLQYGSTFKESKSNVKVLRNEITNIVTKNSYKNLSLTEFNNRIKESGIDLDVRREVSSKSTLHLQQYDKDKFRLRFSNPKQYFSLIPLWNIRSELSSQSTISTWKQFIKFMLQSKEAVKWIRLLIAGHAVAKVMAKPKELANIYGGDPNVVGSQGDDAVKALLNIRHQLSGEVKARYISILLPMVIAKDLKTRESPVYSTYLMSELDFRKRQDIMDMPMLMHGLFIIVYKDYYRVRLKHHKNAHRGDASAEVDMEGNQLNKYPYLLEMIPDLIWAYKEITGHHVKYNSYEPRWTTTNFSPKLDEHEDHTRMIKCHNFPLILPFFGNGSKSYMTIDGIPADATDVYLHGNIEKMIPDELTKNAWGNRKAVNFLLKQSVTVEIDGKRVNQKLVIMKNAPVARVESYCPFYYTNNSREAVKQSFVLLNDILRNIQGVIVLPEKYFSIEHHFKYDDNISDQLKILSDECTLNFKHLGRYGQDSCELAAINLLMIELRGDADAERWLKQDEQRVMLEADHGTKKIAIESYKPFKSDELSDKSQLIRFNNGKGSHTGMKEHEQHEMILRMASHSECRPSRNSCPSSFVQSVNTDGNLKSRLCSFEKLNRHEQSMQLFYLSCVWMVYKKLDQLSANMGNPSRLFITVKKKYNDIMSEAGACWDEKHKKSFAEQAMTVVTPVTNFISRCTTPRSKRKRDSDSDDDGRSNKKPS